MKKLFWIFSLSILLIFIPTPVFADGCVPILQTPTIYQIQRTADTGTLYINPVSDQVDNYTVMYGLSAGDERYSAMINYGNTSGAISYTISGLDPAQTYYFEIRANNACSNSPWSDWVKSANIATAGVTPTNGKPSLPVTGSETTVVGLLGGTSILVLGAFLLFKSSHTN